LGLWAKRRNWFDPRDRPDPALVESYLEQQ
jgi:hypothetical protein